MLYTIRNEPIEGKLANGLLSMYSSAGVFHPSVFAVGKVELASEEKNISSRTATQQIKYYTEVPVSTIYAMFSEEPPLGYDILKRVRLGHLCDGGGCRT